MYRILFLSAMLSFTCSTAQAGQLAGIEVEDQITIARNTTLKLNGMGLREKAWFDIYVGSLYLATPSHDAAEVIAQPGPFRVQMDILYAAIAGEKLVAAWQEGFEKNQSADSLAELDARIKQFNALFSESALKGDRIQIDYLPSKGTRVIKNNKLLGTIEGEDFKKAVLAIWLGNAPADAELKEGMLDKQGE